VTSIGVPASITGAIWFVKGKGDVLKDVVLTVETRRERLAVAYVGQNKRALFEPSRVVVVETKDGEPIVARDNPEKSFEGQLRETPWDDGHVAYFVGEALWTYLNRGRFRDGGDRANRGRRRDLATPQGDVP
jgi:hypothetical protein